jgi:hypothetical protein
MADRGQIAFVFSVFELDFIWGEPAAVYRFDQLLVIARQPLSPIFDLLCVHFSVLASFDANNPIRMQARREV